MLMYMPDGNIAGPEGFTGRYGRTARTQATFRLTRGNDVPTCAAFPGNTQRCQEHDPTPDTYLRLGSGDYCSQVLSTVHVYPN